jgi:MoaA/NifB/PqqE/SkfB family radical SAM enzyme
MSDATDEGLSGPMRLHDAARNTVRAVARRSTALKRVLKDAQMGLGLAEHTLAEIVPAIIRPRPRRLTVAVTAHCNLRCTGCRYGRDFMPGEQLSLEKMRELLDDARACGVELVRLYGGEPLLHPDLPEMVRHSVGLGLGTYVTTNGTLLRHRFDALYEAGLRNLTIGFYGTGARYDAYVGRRDRYVRLEEGVSHTRQRYGKAVAIQLNYLIMRPSCDLEALNDAWNFAVRHDLSFHTDLIHYSLPYFTEGPDRMLQFTETDRPAVEALTAELVRLKQADPERMRDSLMSLRSIPDWLFKGPDMRVPCDARNLLWVGADGTVQMCYVTFKLGNLHEQRLTEMLFGDTHKQAARDAFALNCPNCHCERDSRVQKHLPSRLLYGKPPS